MSDVKCPECGKVIDFHNVMGYDDEKVEVLGIVYSFRCLLCGCVFVSGNRMSKGITEEQKEKIIDLLKKGDY